MESNKEKYEKVRMDGGDIASNIKIFQRLIYLLVFTRFPPSFFTPSPIFIIFSNIYIKRKR